MTELERISMCFDGKGNLEVYDGRGDRIEPRQGNLCDMIGDGKVVNAGCIPYVQVEGSCYRWVYWGGWIRIPC